MSAETPTARPAGRRPTLQVGCVSACDARAARELSGDTLEVPRKSPQRSCREPAKNRLQEHQWDAPNGVASQWSHEDSRKSWTVSMHRPANLGPNLQNMPGIRKKLTRCRATFAWNRQTLRPILPNSALDDARQNLAKCLAEIEPNLPLCWPQPGKPNPIKFGRKRDKFDQVCPRFGERAEFLLTPSAHDLIWRHPIDGKRAAVG